MKSVITIGLSIALGLASVASYAGYDLDLGVVQVQPNDSKSIKLDVLNQKFLYTVTCSILNLGDPEETLKMTQNYNDFGLVTVDGEPVNKVNGRETVQWRLKPNTSILVINDVNDNSGLFMKDYLNFHRSPSNSKTGIDISCNAKVIHNS